VNVTVQYRQLHTTCLTAFTAWRRSTNYVHKLARRSSESLMVSQRLSLQCHFYPRDAMLVHYMLWPSVCLSYIENGWTDQDHAMMPSAFPTVCWKVIQYFRNEGYFPLERCPKLCRAWKNVAARHVASLSHRASTFVYNTARVARVRLRQLRVVLVRRCYCRRHHRHYNCVVSSRLSDETASWSHTQRRCCIALAHALQTPCGVAAWLAEFVAWTKLTHVAPG